MKFLRSAALFLLAAGFSTTASAQFAQIFPVPGITSGNHAKMVMMDNELERNDLGSDTDFHANPLMLNGRRLDYMLFSNASSGKLQVAEGEVGVEGSSFVPFTVRLRRNGKLVSLGDGLNKATTEVEISEILSKSQPGDHLIIRPVNPAHWKAKRILRVMTPATVPNTGEC